MKKLLTFGALLATLATPSVSSAHSEIIIGAAIGGATGAALGNSMGGNRDSVIIWSALGSAAGAAIAHNMGTREREVVVVRDELPVRHIVRERPAYREIYVRPSYERAYYYYDAPRRGRWHKHHRHHEHDDD